MCPAYIAGLVGPGDRKSVQPLAARDMSVTYDQLHHFITSGVWDAARLEAVLRAAGRAIRTASSAQACPMAIVPTGPSRRSHWQRSTGFAPRASASAACSLMRDMA
jgi:SRSO17 transposase